MAKNAHPNSTPETPMLVPGRVEDLLAKYVMPYVNPVARKLPTVAVVKHRGRTSGKGYETPVTAFRKDDVIAIGLLHGKTQWVRNVLAAGEATIRMSGKDLHVSNPRIVPPGSDATGLPKAAKSVLRRMAVIAFDVD
ncbi:MAG: nitroreductase family deazaflavin-dependent oxidoreductase [Gordonia sp. (in: high G+C Gram-positive bacteria)]